MKYTVDYCKNNRVAIQVNSEEELKELYAYFNIVHFRSYDKESNYHRFCEYEASLGSFANNTRDWFESYKFEVITFQQFKDSQMKTETKKILGYLAPILLFGGKVEKGTIFKSTSSHPTTTPMFLALDKEGKVINPAYCLPKEIVETWEAVFEDEFKVGDFVYVIKSQAGSFGAENRVGKLTNSINTQGIGEKEKKFKGKFNVLIEGVVWNIGKADVRKATQAEIDSLFTKTLTLSNGKEVIVKRGTVIAENTEVNVQDLNNLIKDWIIQMGKWTVVVIDITFNIGCWKNVKLIDIQNILLEVERQEELMKD